MAVTVYKSTDASAPVLTGVAGSLITVLNAILVDGYGAKAAAGWTKPYTGTNAASYRTASGVQHYLQVDDNSPNASAVGREGRARGFVSMSAQSTGTEPFPTTTQVGDTVGPMIRKSKTADATARPWICVADGRSMYFFTKPGDFGNGWSGFATGEFFSIKTADSYRSILAARIVSAGAGTALDSNDNLDSLSPLNSVVAGHYVPRTWQGDVAGASNIGKHGNAAHSDSVLAGRAMYPNPYDDSLMLSQVWVHHDGGSNAVIAGRMRGFWHFCHPVGVAVNDGDTFSGSGALSGKSFLVIKPGAEGDSVYVMETSDTWETN